MTLINGRIFTAEPIDATHERCPVVTKRRHITLDQGQLGEVLWGMRCRDGTVADLSECVAASSGGDGSVSESGGGVSIQVRFAKATGGTCGGIRPITSVEAEVVSPGEGLIRFPVPTDIASRAGVYQFQAALIQDGQPFFMDRGLISVEPGLFGELSQVNGPPTIGEIRLHIRDSQIENDLLQAVEFDDDEIVHCIVRPVLQWNETPPPVARFTTETFPFRFNWLNAIVGELLQIAVHHYMRNKMKTEAGGLIPDDKNKDAEYQRLAAKYQEEWAEFIVRKKVQINASGGWDSMQSTYSRRGYW